MGPSREHMEKYSSAATLSDMEIFIFPELLYSLVLANIISPVIWEWKRDAWFKNMERLTPYRRILRLKQFIMENYDFNLDLETWGLTTKEKELARFKPFMEEEAIKRSNALFGYEGDKYYFSVDIRKHFGLDKYNSNVIPYWKTETVEAMDAFKYKQGFSKGAGECVSFSTLYAAALFIVCAVPLDKIFLLATPLHSQNFVDVNGGILTNNRRVITKNMWFNGTELTARAQRALRNEQVTIVAHSSGYVHVVYPRATMDKRAYAKFERKLKEFLTADLDGEILYNFLRQEKQLQKYFQIMHLHNGRKRYIRAEKAYAYEHTSAFRLNDSTREKLFQEIDEYEFSAEPLPERICLNQLEEFFTAHRVDFTGREGLEQISSALDCAQFKKNEILDALFNFCHLTPRLPHRGKEFMPGEGESLEIHPGMEREEIAAYLAARRKADPTADLAFYAARDFALTSWEPFIKAAVERNPVSLAGTAPLPESEIIRLLAELPEQSIYGGTRMAQPDEVWNFQRGDGLEKAICLANILINRNREQGISLHTGSGQVLLTWGEKKVQWPSAKGLRGKIEICDHEQGMQITCQKGTSA